MTEEPNTKIVNEIRQLIIKHGATFPFTNGVFFKVFTILDGKMPIEISVSGTKEKNTLFRFISTNHIYRKPTFKNSNEFSTSIR